MLIRFYVILSFLCLSCLAVQADDNSTANADVFVHPVVSNYTSLWWRNFRDPSYCTMVLCRGACAYRGGADHSACTLVPMYPILDSGSCCKDEGCSR